MPETPKRSEWHDGYRMAMDLIKRHPIVFKDVPPLMDILFVLDTDATPSSKGRSIGARVSKMPPKFADFVYDGNKEWILESFQANNEYMTPNQMKVLMAHELLHFEYDEDKNRHTLRGHDFEDFRIIVDRLGLRWASQYHGDVPDIMASDFEWGGKNGQSRLELSAHVDEIAQKVAASAPGHEVTVSTGGKEATAKVLKDPVN